MATSPTGELIRAPRIRLSAATCVRLRPDVLDWTSQGKVIEADPGQAFAFECSMMDFHFSTWGYRIEPTESGCRVTEWSEDLRPGSALEFSKQMSGVEDRAARNAETMSMTLERLAARLEG